MPERGASPFPTIEADAYRSYSTGIRGKGAEGDTMQVDWERLKEEIKPMQAQLGREHIAFYSQYDPDSDQYTYSPHGLIFSEEAVARADGKSGLILYEIQQTESKHLNKLVLIHAPISRQAIDEMRIWARGGGSSSAQQNARATFMSNSVDGGSYIDCGDYASWIDGMGCVHDEEIIVTPDDNWIDDPFFNPESLDEEDDNGGFYPPQPGETDCEVAYNCSPDGGGVNPGPVPEPDPCEGDDPPDYCSEPDLCLGDPLPNPEITPTSIAGVEGGRFRTGSNAVRQDEFGNKLDHKGFDISTPLNPPTPIYAMFPGTISATRDTFEIGEYREGSLGNFVQITSTVNGQTIVVKFNHLNSVDVYEGQTVSAGDIIGIGGNTGNAAAEGVKPHTHIQTWEVDGTGWTLVNPEDYMTTQFDEEGTSQSNCN